MEETLAKSANISIPVYDEIIKKLGKRFSELGLQQIKRIFLLYDSDKTGSVSVEKLPTICNDLNIKPWKALKEFEVNNGKITFEAFADWWFSQGVQHSREEEEYVSHIFDKYDNGNTGKIDANDLVKLCLDLNEKPWKAYREMDVDLKEGISKKVFLKWWFSGHEQTGNTFNTTATAAQKDSNNNNFTTPSKFRPKRSSLTISTSTPAPSTSSSSSSHAKKVQEAMKKLSDIQIQVAELSSMLASLMTPATTSPSHSS